jgi:ribosome maturation factor RimP
MTQLVSDLELAVAPLVQSAGATLYACQLTHEDGVPSIVVMIEQEGGVTIKTCADLNRTIKLVLEVDYAQLLEQYQLVVSSPGIERPLLTAAHYEKAVGSDILLTLKKAQNSIKRFEARLEKIDGNQITLVSDLLGELHFSLNDVAKANILWKKGAKNE